VYIGSVSSSIVGYLFWIISTGFVSPDVVGTASAILALQTLLTTIVSLGLSTGAKRFICLKEQDPEYEDGSIYLSTTVILTFIVNVPIVLLLVLANYFQIPLFGLTSNDIGFVAILMFLGFWSPIITSLFDSLLKTRVTAVSQIVSSLAKLGVGFVLLLLEMDFLGIMISFIVAAIAADLILLVGLGRLSKEFTLTVTFDTVKSRELLQGSLPAWIPNTLMIAGQSIGVLVLYNFVGNTETGLYYIAYAVASIVYTLPTSILGLMFPVLSGMVDGRKRAASNAIRLSMALTVPIAITIAIFPEIPFIFIGADFVGGYGLLSILLLGAIIYPIYAGYYGYVYAIGKYTHVLGLGVIINLCRILLYLLFVSSMGAAGIAMAFVISIAISVFAIIPSSMKIGFRFHWITYAKPIVASGGFALVLIMLSINWIFGAPLLLILSLISYTRMGIVTKDDLVELSSVFLSEEALAKVSTPFKPILRILFGDTQ
jgi:O-antigen/teichoic acid export membrane protein